MNLNGRPRLVLPDHAKPDPLAEPPLMSDDPRVVGWLQSLGLDLNRAVGVEIAIRFGAPVEICVHRIADSRVTDDCCPLADGKIQYRDDARIQDPPGDNGG